MRIRNLYVVYDKEAKTCVGPIMPSHNHVAALRELRELANNKQTVIGRTPADYQLLYVAVIDDETGQVQGNENPEVTAEAADLVTSET